MSDTNRLRTLVQASAGELAYGIDHQGHRYAMTNAAATLSSKSQLVETITGLSQVFTPSIVLVCVGVCVCVWVCVGVCEGVCVYVWV